MLLRCQQTLQPLVEREDGLTRALSRTGTMTQAASSPSVGQEHVYADPEAGIVEASSA